MVASEMVPLVSSGGLADVVGALPRALRAAGHDVRVVIPFYRQIPAQYHGEPFCLVIGDMGGRREHGAMRYAEVGDPPVPVYLIEHDGFFHRPFLYSQDGNEYWDNCDRYAFFAHAVMHGIPQTGWRPDIVHCHDWHAAGVPLLLHTWYRKDTFWGGRPSVLSIHNLAFQGRYGGDRYFYTGLPNELFHGDCVEFFGDMNMLKGAILISTRVSTVSPRYAKEIQTPEYGCGLDGPLERRREHVVGIMNGVDYGLWHPSTDPHLDRTYAVETLDHKRACKRALQQMLDLPESDAPLLGIVSRLSWQKGIDLVAAALDQIMAEGLQFVILGSGDRGLEEHLANRVNDYPDRLRVLLKFDIPVSHKIEAGCDFFVMPSRYEPCGLTQLYSLAYGTVPIVRHTGGLADSVVDTNVVTLRNKTATGISFAPSTPDAVVRSIARACDLYRDPAAYRQVQETGMHQDYSWGRSAERYVELYREAIAAS